MRQIPLFEVKNKLSFFVQLAEQGERIEITRHGKTSAVLVGAESQTTTEDIPATGHDWGDPVWSWSADHTTATVTLTYTYGNDNVTKDVTVTQGGNPNVINNISDITEVGAQYHVKGTVLLTHRSTIQK